MESTSLELCTAGPEPPPKPKPWNMELRPDGTLKTRWSPSDVDAHHISWDWIHELDRMNGLRPAQVVLQRDTRMAALKLSRCGWRIEPAAARALEAAAQAYQLARAPLYPLPANQRMAYLDEEDSILCRLDLGSEENGAARFRAGTSYPLRSQKITVTRSKPRRALNGDLEQVQLTGQELGVFVTAENGRECMFVDARWVSPDSGAMINVPWLGGPRLHRPRFTLQQLAEHFEIPEVPDIASCHPETWQRNLEVLTGLEELLR